MRKRNLYLVGGSILAAILILISNPAIGVSAVFGIQVLTGVIAVFFAHIMRKALFDYTSMEDLISKASETSTGSAVVVLAIAIVTNGLLQLFSGRLVG
jgi:hypothetical protein